MNCTTREDKMIKGRNSLFFRCVSNTQNTLSENFYKITKNITTSTCFAYFFSIKTYKLGFFKKKRIISKDIKKTTERINYIKN